jgi:hypothetical protein
MGQDYAADLLGGSKEQPASRSTDYASDLLGGSKTQKPERFSENLKARARETEGSADFAPLVKASMVDDPHTKLKIFAKSRFPKLDEKEAISRYGIVDGEVYYVDDDGKVKNETASGLKNFAAGMVADSPAIAGGVAGSVLGAPGGPALMALGGAMGAEAGAGYKKVIANLALDEPQTVGGNAGSMLGEGLFSAGGNLVGLAFAKAITRGAARDIAKLDPAKVAEIDKKAAAEGIDLNVAQRTNLPSTKAKYDVLASMPTSRDIVAEHAAKQADQASNAAEKFINRVSKVADVDEAGTQARDAAKKVISKLTQERSAAASPLYRKAFTEFAEFSEPQLEHLAQLRTSPTFKDAERLAKRLYADDLATMGEKEMPQAGALRDLHYTKLALDKLIGDSATGGYSKTARGQIIGLKNELLKVMDDASPTYAKARETFSHMTPNIVSVQDGIISKVAGLKDEQALTAAREVFSDGRSPAAVERMRSLFVKSGLEDDWNALLASHLRETFSKAGQETMAGGAVNQSPKWRAALVGNPRQYRLMEKAMSPQQFGAFNDMMDVFEAMGRTASAGQGSQTMTRQEGTRLLRDEAGSGLAGQTANLLSPQNFGSRAGQWLAEVRLGNHAEKLAEVMTAPDGIKRLRELKRLSPNDQRFIAGASSLFGISLRQANKAANAGGEQAYDYQQQ